MAKELYFDEIKVGDEEYLLLSERDILCTY